MVDRKFLAYLEKKAVDLGINAAMSGSHSDGGQRALQAQIAIYEAGVRGLLPEQWRIYLAEYEKVNDPEFAEYQRLQRKFGK